MSGLRIRRALAADLERLLALDGALFGPDTWSRNAFAAEVDPPVTGRLCVVAVRGEEVIGYAAVHAVSDVADLVRIGVAPSHQREGVGSALVTAALDRARTAGSDRLLLEVARDNFAAGAFYRRLGFHEVATRARYYANGSDALVLARAVSAQPLDEPEPSPVAAERRSPY